MARHSRKHHKRSRKLRSRRHRSRRHRGGFVAPVGWSNPEPMELNLAQGQQYDKFHAQQHGGALAYGAFPGTVTQGSFLPTGLMASARQDPLMSAYADIKQYGPSSDNPNLAGGRRRRRRRGTRRQNGGDFVRWGGRRRMNGGSYAEMRNPMPIGDEGKMLIPASLQAQAGLNPEWRLAEDPMSFAPIAR